MSEIRAVTGNDHVQPVELRPRAGVQARADKFSDALRRADGQAPSERPPEGSLGDAIRRAGRSLAEGERMVDGMVRAARRGHTLSQEELLAVQAGVYRYTYELELGSKVVDKATQSVKTTLQSQQ